MNEPLVAAAGLCLVSLLCLGGLSLMGLLVRRLGSFALLLALWGETRRDRVRDDDEPRLPRRARLTPEQLREQAAQLDFEAEVRRQAQGAGVPGPYTILPPDPADPLADLPQPDSRRRRDHDDAFEIYDNGDV
jgi:hypothetical protein